MRLRNWAWFGIVQKTRPLIGMINIEEEIQLLENAAVNAIKESEKEASEKKRLENDNKRLERKNSSSQNLGPNYLLTSFIGCSRSQLRQNERQAVMYLSCI